MYELVVVIVLFTTTTMIVFILFIIIEIVLLLITIYCYLLFIISSSGEYICRQTLPGGAGIPGSSDTLVFVPIWLQPVIEIFSLGGQRVRTVGREQLGVPGNALGTRISPAMQGGILYYKIAAPKHQILCYQVSIS